MKSIAAGPEMGPPFRRQAELRAAVPCRSFRYFVFVGSVLVALLFAIDRYLPTPPETGHASDPDKTIIRIRSARSLPEKIVFDTRPQTAAPRWRT